MKSTIDYTGDEIIVRARKRKSWAERLEEYKANGYKVDEFGVTFPSGNRYYKMA